VLDVDLRAKIEKRQRPNRPNGFRIIPPVGPVVGGLLAMVIAPVESPPGRFVAGGGGVNAIG
jgi:hypothetical protein